MTNKDRQDTLEQDMKIYLDLCVYNRPFDDQTQPRIMIESLCFIIIMAKVSNEELLMCLLDGVLFVEFLLFHQRYDGNTYLHYTTPGFAKNKN